MKRSAYIFGIVSALISIGCCVAGSFAYPEWYSLPLSILGLVILPFSVYANLTTHESVEEICSQLTSSLPH